MASVLESITGFLGIKLKKDDDIFDRLSSRFTVALLLGCLAVISVYKLGDSPLKCWAPVHFTGGWMKYANNYCWIENTYHVPMNADFPRPEHTETKKRHEILYYQWVPFILVLQCALFYFPSLVWHALNQRGGIDSDQILDCANSLTKPSKTDIDGAKRKERIDYICNSMNRFLGNRIMSQKLVRRRRLNGLRTVFSSRFSSYLVLLYIVCKLLYLGNAIVQFVILTKLFYPEQSAYIKQVMGVSEPAYEDDDENGTIAPVFPKVTFCDFDIRRLGFNQKYALQCALPLNLWHERVYQIIWVWTGGVMVLTAVGLLIWLFRFMCSSDSVKFISNHLEDIIVEREKHDAQSQERNLHTLEAGINGKQKLRASRYGIKDEVEEFLNDYLRNDGVFLLRLIAHNTSYITTKDITVALWKMWEEARKLPKDTTAKRVTATPGDSPDGNLKDGGKKHNSKGGEESIPLLSTNKGGDSEYNVNATPPQMTKAAKAFHEDSNSDSDSDNDPKRRLKKTDDSFT